MAKPVSQTAQATTGAPQGTRPGEPLLRVEGLVTTVVINGRKYNAVDNVSFELRQGEVLGIVGESAAGKSMTALSIIRLVRPPARVSAGRILFAGTDLLTLSEEAMSKRRGGEIAMVSQDPMTALNPVKTIGDQMVRVIRLHTKSTKSEAVDRAVEMMSRVGIPSPRERLASYPHQFSGGMLQRISIAMALSCNPKLLIADEPTTALDVTIQAQILELLHTLRQDLGMAVLLITHNLGVVAEFCDRVAVMYAGKIVEDRVTGELIRAPRQPYSEGLLSVSPSLDQELDRLPTIKGRMPSLQQFPPGCRFHPRCPYAFERCAVEVPALLPLADGSRVACHLYDGQLDRMARNAREETEKSV